ncbi:hypothetical protein ACLOJK_000170 [Asimina triloba]
MAMGLKRTSETPHRWENATRLSVESFQQRRKESTTQKKQLHGAAMMAVVTMVSRWATDAAGQEEDSDFEWDMEGV